MTQVHGELKTWHKITVDFEEPQSNESAATFRNYRSTLLSPISNPGRRVRGFGHLDSGVGRRGARVGRGRARWHVVLRLDTDSLQTDAGDAERRWVVAAADRSLIEESELLRERTAGSRRRLEDTNSSRQAH